MFFSRMMFFRMIMLFHGHSEIEGGKECENISLDECHQQFQEAHEYAESNGYRRNGHTQHAFDISEDKDQAHEAQDDDMPGGNVRKKTDHEDERLGENAKEFDEWHQWNRKLKPPGHARRIINMLPVILIRTESGYDESKQSQDPGNSYISGYIGPEWEDWDQPDEVVEEDEEENR